MVDGVFEIKGNCRTDAIFFQGINGGVVGIVGIGDDGNPVEKFVQSDSVVEFGNKVDGAVGPEATDFG